MIIQGFGVGSQCFFQGVGQTRESPKPRLNVHTSVLYYSYLIEKCTIYKISNHFIYSSLVIPDIFQSFLMIFFLLDNLLSLVL